MRNLTIVTGLAWVVLAIGCAGPAGSSEHTDGPVPVLPPVATFSIVAYDPANGDLGVAVQSRFLAVGSVVPWARAGVGAIATQSFANVAYGPDGLKMLAEGKNAKEVVAALTEADRRRARRQVGIVDARGNAASFTGEGCLAWAGHHEGKHFCCQGNILTGKEVVAGMAAAFEKARAAEGQGELAEWLVAALQAGQEAGGDRRGKQSAALLVVRAQGGYAGGNDRYIDLRVDDHPDPITELGRLLELHRKVWGPRRPR